MSGEAGSRRRNGRIESLLPKLQLACALGEGSLIHLPLHAAAGHQERPERALQVDRFLKTFAEFLRFQTALRGSRGKIKSCFKALYCRRDRLGIGVEVIVLAFAVVAIGGMGSILGAFLAAVLISELNTFGILVWPQGTLVLMFILNAFNQIYMISVQTALQLRVPDDLRGRVMGIWSMTYNMGPLGAMLSGAIAEQSDAGIAILVGGVALMAFSAGPGLVNRSVRRLEASPAPA